MTWLIIPIAFLIISALAIGFIFFKRLPQIKLLDVESLPSAKQRKTKEKIILERVERFSQKKFGKVGQMAVRSLKRVSETGRRAVQKLYALEQYYERLKKTSATGEAGVSRIEVKKLLEEADALLKEDEFVLAEKKLIEVISHNPKLVEAYEDLGNLYLRARQYQQARETLLFALRLDPEDASVHMSMAELEMLEGNPKAAVAQLRQAVQKRSQNPKYLDLYIEAALAAGMKEDAQEGIGLLKQANPDNQKIEQFEQRLAEIF